jgi:predicted nuclease of restriction endonuclease-like (RecB) superfamily
MNYYNEIKERLIKSEIYDRAKDYAKDRNKVKVYYEIGKLLSEAGKEYGKNIIKQYSEKLMVEVGKKYNKRTLFRMKQFYNVFSDEKVSTLWTQLTWSHIRLLFDLNLDAINYYIHVVLEQHITVRDLENRIKLCEYERLPEATQEKLITKEQLKVNDLVPNPIIIKAKSLKEEITEYALKQLILINLDEFLSQLGNGFTYVGNEYKIKISNTYNYIDLLLYNIKYKCYVVIELKATELKKDHTGQIMTYMNYIDNNIKTIEENSTVGIIICKQDNEYVIKYCSDSRIISRKYELV